MSCILTFSYFEQTLCKNVIKKKNQQKPNIKESHCILPQNGFFSFLTVKGFKFLRVSKSDENLINLNI